MASLPVYALRSSEVFEALATSPRGLTAAAVADLQSLYGQNLLAKPARPVHVNKWLGFIAHPMALVLWLAGFVSFISGKVELGIVIWCVILLNASFSFWREYQAEQAVTALQKLLPKFARVVRDGQEMNIPAGEVVPGDLLLLAQGDQIPADARIVEEYGLRVNNAVLTGEAIATRKMADASIRDDISEIERPNLVFAGTTVVAGTARAVAYATGMLTQFGRISNLTERKADQPSRLQIDLLRITRIISWIAIGIGALVFLESYLDLNLTFSEALILAIGIIVAAIPEGLVPTVTLTLAMSVQRLAQRGVLVKKLSTVETLGTVSVVCTDKSGTLTQNQMTVREIWSAGRLLSVTGGGFEPQGEFLVSQEKPARKIDVGRDTDLQELLRAGLLCNNARLSAPSPEKPAWTSLGDQTEVALRVVAIKGGLDEKATLRQHPRIHELPFDASRKRMSTIHLVGGERMVFVKGAPKEVLQLCSGVLIRGEVAPLDRATRAVILAANDAYARGALRVLALARRRLPDEYKRNLSPDTVERDLTFLGLTAMMDPPRPEVAAAVGKLHTAGIRMVMITGDYGLTAESMARRLGMIDRASPRILTGTELDGISDQELRSIVRDEVIYARMAPDHKLRLVNAFQANGEVVAVIGDGVNDAPALRKADVGIAMGMCGTDISKEASDVILIGDNFGSVATAIEEGRAVYENLRKFITYIFSSNVPEILPFVLTALFNIPLALSVIQILAIDLGTDLLPALALGMERPEPDIMERPPRDRSQPIIDKPLLARAFLWLGPIEAVLCFIGFFSVYAVSGAGGKQALPLIETLSITRDSNQLYMLATTLFTAGVVTCQIGNVYACRTEKGRIRRLGWFSNPTLLIGIAVEILMLLVMVYLPPVARVFQHVTFPPILWIGIGANAPILYLLEKGRKVLNGYLHQLHKPRYEEVRL